jgi:hypothetical protein
VLVAITHPTLRRLTCQLLAREHGCWETVEPAPQEPVAASVARVRPDLLVIDGGRFPSCCGEGLPGLGPEQVVVVDPEQASDYRSAALAARAGGWVASETIAEELSLEMRRILGCQHAPCPVHVRVAHDDRVPLAGSRRAHAARGR